MSYAAPNACMHYENSMSVLRVHGVYARPLGTRVLSKFSNCTNVQELDAVLQRIKQMFQRKINIEDITSMLSKFFSVVLELRFWLLLL